MLIPGALKGKTIMVTGGGSGLGKSMSTYFSELGAKIVIVGRRMDALETTANEIVSATGGEVLAHSCDVREYDQVVEAMKKGVEKFGKIDVLINNAAGNFISPTERLSHRAFDSVVDIVLKGSYNCTLALGKYWIEHKIPANVLSIVTTYAWTGSAYVVPSACGKAGVLALTRSLAVEWAKYKIRLNAIAPGPFPTKGAWSRLFPEVIEKMLDPLAEIPLGRFGEHQELANLAAYLVSDFASYITGEVVTIDGGEWLQDAGQFSNFSRIPNEMWDAIDKQVRGTKSKS